MTERVVVARCPQCDGQGHMVGSPDFRGGIVPPRQHPKGATCPKCCPNCLGTGTVLVL